VTPHYIGVIFIM